MSIFPEFERELVELARRSEGVSGADAGRAGAMRRRLFRWTPARTRLAVAAMACGVALVVAVAFLAVGHRGGGATPSGQGRPPAGWVHAAQAAREDAARRDPGCRIYAARIPPPADQRFVTTTPAAVLSSAFGVFREPAPVTQRVSADRLRRLQLNAQDFYLRYARHGVRDGVSYFLVPAAKVWGGTRLPARCWGEILAAFRGRVERLRPQERAAAIRFERRQLAAAERQSRPQPGVCLVASGNGFTGVGCKPAWLILSFNGVWGAGSGGTNGDTRTVLLLPDDAASVTAHYAAKHQVGDVPHPITVTQHVTDNLVIFNLVGGWDPPSLTVRSRDGLILWSNGR